MAKRAGEELEVAVAMCVGRARSGLEKVALVMTLEELQEADAARELASEILWTQSLLKCALKLSGGDGSYRDAKMYGMASDYGRLHSPALSPKEFYEHFRFAREQIPRLVLALKMPAWFRTPSRCRIGGGEALLVFLKVCLN